jgi:hypothetical protein
MIEGRQNQVVRQSSSSSKNGIANPWTPDDKRGLAETIGRVFDLQKQFGKTTAQLENIVAGFCWALQDYPLPKVIEGIRTYIKLKPDIPTPADIRQIIDPIIEPWKPDWSTYNRFKKLRKSKDLTH